MQVLPQRRLRSFVPAVCAVAWLLLGASPVAAQSANIQATIDFDLGNLPAGTILDAIDAVGGESGTVGPIGVLGTYPGTPGNSAVIFDSAMRSGGDSDLGSPNGDFGGPGIGAGGELGQPHENDSAQRNILIVAEDLIDLDGDGLVDDPDDGAVAGMVLEFDFTTIQAPFTPTDVTVTQITTIDSEGSDPGTIELFDAASALLWSAPLIAGGDNGLVRQWIGTPGLGISGATHLRVTLNGSSSIDDIVFELATPSPPTCTISSDDSSGPGSGGGASSSASLSAEVDHFFTFTVEGMTDPGYSGVVLSASNLLPGMIATPALPLDSGSASSIATTISWVPTLADEGTYLLDFLVTDPLGQNSYCSVEIEVECDLEIDPTTQPTSQVLCAGESTSFSVYVDATSEAYFQWKRDGVPIPGANTPSLALTSLTSSDSGTYVLTITNPCGTLASHPAVVTVVDPPSISAQPTSTHACEGSDASFTVGYPGSSWTQVQWSKDGIPIAGATDATLTLTRVTASDEGSYTAYLTNDCGDATSIPATFIVRNPPSIDQHPSDRTECSGDSATFSVSASGSHPLSYQWRKDGTPILGATSASYTLTSIDGSDAGAYTVTVLNDCGYEESSAAHLYLRYPPEVDDHPDDTTVCEGEKISLHVDASGSHPLSYQWKKDGVEIPGEESSTLTILGATTSDAGEYTVRVENDCGYDESYAANVYVREAPEIVEHPSDKELCKSETLTLTVTASGSHPLAYQWKRDGVEISGATSATLTISSVSTSDEGSYTVRVENDCGYAVSDPAYVEVREKPEIIDHPDDQTLCEGETISLSVIAMGSEPLSYQWKKDGTSIAGATSPTLEISSATMLDSGSYTVRVENDCGYEESDPAHVEVRKAPQILVHPMGQTLCEGDMLTLSVTASGSDPLSYQWKKDGAPIAGETSPTFTIASVEKSDAGSYTVRVENDCGDDESDPADVVVRVAPEIAVEPMDQVLCEGETILLMVTATGSDPLTYTWARDGMILPGQDASTLMITGALASDSGIYTVTVSNDCGQATSGGATVTVRVAPTITVDPIDQTLCEGETISLSVMAAGTPPLLYQWLEDGAPIPGATDAVLMIPNALATDSGSYAVTVTNACGEVTSAPATVLVRVAPTITIDPEDQTICNGATLTLMVTATGTDPLSYQWRRDGVELAGQTAATLMIPAITIADAGVYDVVVTNVCGMATSAGATVVVELPRTITEDPMSQEICTGDPVTFTVTVTGTDPFGYQWRKDGIAIAGATASSFTIPSVAPADGGNYDVVVTNTCGSATSQPATLTVLLPPTITVQPVGDDVCLGENFSLTVSATGALPLAYQWSKDGIAIPGATNATLDLSPIALTDAGSYTVLVSNICGDATSAPAIVTVLTPPTVTTQPMGGTVCLGDPLSLTVVAEGTAPLAYQWRLDGTPIPGATQATYSVPAVALADAGSYTVVVTNICGSATSTPAEVIVAEEPLITLDSPMTEVLCQGDTVTLMTTVTGTTPIDLSWEKDGVPIPGAGAANFTITNATPADAGSYQLIATNLCGTDEGPTVTVTVRVPPTITTQPMGDDEICPDEMRSFTFTVVATGSAPLSYQWRKDGAPIAGATASSYTIENVTLADYGDYSVVVMNDCGSVTSANAPFLEPVPGFCEVEFERGNCNGDLLTDIADGIYIMRFTFQGFNPPICFDACDHNDDGMIDVADAVYLITYMFLGGEPPGAPFGECGVDPTLDELDCPAFAPCEL